MDGFKGRKVILTGGSKGIGRAAAERLASAGANVVVAARGQAALDETVDKLRSLGSAEQVFGSVSMDVADREAVERGCREAIDKLGGLDVLICNSGYAWPGLADELPPEAYESMLNVNYLGHVWTVRACLPTLIEQKKGHICLVSSVLGFLPLFGYTAYCGSKFAIVGFAEVLRMEMKEHGVDVSLFFPPTTDTPGLAQENELKPRITFLMEHDSAFSATYQPGPVAESLLAHIASGRFERTYGGPNHLMLHFLRHFPNIARWANDDEVRKAQKKASDGVGGGSER